MTGSRRTRMSPGDRRAQLLGLGVDAIADAPLDALTLERLAERAGVSRGLVVYYFGTKDGLHHEVVRAARDGMLHATAPDTALAPMDRLHDTLTRLVRFVRDHRVTFYSLVRGAASGASEVREAIEEARTIQAGWLVDAMIESGADDTELLRIALRSWVAFAEQTLVDGALHSEMSSAEIVEFLERSVRAVAGTAASTTTAS